MEVATKGKGVHGGGERESGGNVVKKGPPAGWRGGFLEEGLMT